MKGRAKSRSLLPLVETKTEVIQHGAVGIKAFADRSVYSNELRGEIQHLPELRLTSAQFFLCSITLRDVDYSADKLNELAGCAQNRMSNDVNVPDVAIRMHDAVVCLELCLLADRRLR